MAHREEETVEVAAEPEALLEAALDLLCHRA